MTTCCFKDGILASDSRMTQDVTITSENCKKIYKLSIGYIAFAGSLADGLLLVQHLETGCDIKFDELEVHAIFVDLKGKPFIVEPTGNSLAFLKADKICAIGSGSHFALAAMHSGKSAVEAIKIASKLDVFTNSKIKSVKCLN